LIAANKSRVVLPSSHWPSSAPVICAISPVVLSQSSSILWSI